LEVPVPATVNVNSRTVVHAASDGVLIAFPDVCQAPTPAGPIPLPLPSIALSSDAAEGSREVKMDGQSIMVQGSAFSQSTGDEAGSIGGILSGTTRGKAEFILYSFDVKVEGKNVCRLGDLMVSNNKNTPPFPEIQPPSMGLSTPGPGGDGEDENQLVAVSVREG
jgi:uncharacterized Zn-binding protein involved in type VI secretion